MRSNAANVRSEEAKVSKTVSTDVATEDKDIKDAAQTTKTTTTTATDRAVAKTNDAEAEEQGKKRKRKKKKSASSEDDTAEGVAQYDEYKVGMVFFIFTKTLRSLSKIAININTNLYYSQIEMDLVRAVASLEFVSERGLNSTDQGPYVLANQVYFVIVQYPSYFYFLYLSNCEYFTYIYLKPFVLLINK